MIPKVIHYCWFGGKSLPKSAERCIDSWKKYLPDFEIKRWDESNFDVNRIPYTKEAYSVGKYAFVSDYARLWVIYNYGGLYFDTDVEVIRPLNDIVMNGAFFGVEFKDVSKITVNPGLGYGAPAGSTALKHLMNRYERLHFINEFGEICYKNIVEITTEYLIVNGLQNTNRIQCCSGFTIYPVDFFCPISYETKVMCITNNTHTIHHFAESWVPKSTRVKNAIGRIFGKRFIRFLVRIKGLFKK